MAKAVKHRQVLPKKAHTITSEIYFYTGEKRYKSLNPIPYKYKATELDFIKNNNKKALYGK